MRGQFASSRFKVISRPLMGGAAYGATLLILIIIAQRGTEEQKSCARHELGKNVMKQFCDEVIKKFEENPIDALFCYLQCDKELMKKYLDLVAEKKDLGLINRTLARTFATSRDTKSCGTRNAEPNSSLIQSYSLLEDRN